MRLAWLTPWCTEGGIPVYSRAVLSSLSQVVEVAMLHPATSGTARISGVSSVEMDGRDPVEALRDFDVVVYNLGNHYSNHALIYDWYTRRPGVVVLHDRVMQNFFTTYCRLGAGAAHYLRLMLQSYGSKARPVARRILMEGWTGENQQEYASEYPLFEPCLWNAHGVITHSQSANEDIRHRYGDLLPTIALPMPDLQAEDQDFASTPARHDLGISDSSFVVVASGRFGPTKRLDVIIRAFEGLIAQGLDPLLVLAGGGDDAYLSELRDQVAGAQLGSAVRFALDPDEATLRGYVHAADVCVNLRWPSTETGSATLVEQMSAGKPVIVTRTGVYAELPDEVVLKIDPSDELNELGRALDRLLSDPAYRERLGHAALAYARTHFDRGRYAARLAEFLTATSDRRARLSRIDSAAGVFARSDAATREAMIERLLTDRSSWDAEE